MKSHFLVLCFLSALFVCSGQEDSTSIPLVSYWSVGDTYDFRVTKITQQTKLGEPVKDDSTSYEVKWEVIDSTETGYTIRYAFQTIGALPGGKEVADEMREVLEKQSISEVIYRTNELGEFIEVVNWRELADALSEIFDRATEKINSDDPEKSEMAANIFSVFKRSIASQTGIQELFLNELPAIHFPYGYEYGVDEIVEYEDELPNLFGGPPFSASAKIRVVEFDPVDEYFVLVQELNVNPEDIKLMVRDLLKQMKLSSAKLEEEMKKATVSIQNYNVFAYFYYPGVPVFIEFNRATSLQVGPIQSHKLEITRVELLME